MDSCKAWNLAPLSYTCKTEKNTERGTPKQELKKHKVLEQVYAVEEGPLKGKDNHNTSLRGSNGGKQLKVVTALLILL